MASALVVATTVGLYQVFNQRREQFAIDESLRNEAATIARVIRSGLEWQEGELNFPYLQRMAAESTQELRGWTIEAVPRSILNSERASSDAARRMRALLEGGHPYLWGQVEDLMIYSLPMYVNEGRGPELIGAVEVMRQQGPEPPWATSFLDDLLSLLVIVSLVAVAVSVMTRLLLTRPMQQLLAGMDEVTRGDLTHTLLAEREDEVGQLASHFNDMTLSLRASQAETQDQTDARMLLEQQLQKAEKMATIGQLAAEIAHEVGTPLNVIAGRARAMGRKSQDAAMVGKNAEIIFEQASRITRIIQRLLDFSRRKAIELRPEPVDLNRVCDITLEFLDGRLAAARVTPIVHRGKGIPVVDGYPDQLQQVFINLVVNAVESMPDGGTLEIRTFADQRKRPGLEMSPQHLCAVVEITDSGPGVPAEERERIFEPFYTTKEGEGGTGLGLAVSSSIIKEHDGWIEVDDGANKGAVFRVCIPASQG